MKTVVLVFITAPPNPMGPQRPNEQHSIVKATSDDNLSLIVMSTAQNCHNASQLLEYVIPPAPAPPSPKSPTHYPTASTLANS